MTAPETEPVLWALLLIIFSRHQKTVSLNIRTNRRWSLPMSGVMAVFVLTFLFWMTETWHRLPSEAVALIPVVALPALGLLDAADLRKLEWEILILVVGGMALGVAMEKSGLAALVVQAGPWRAWSPMAFLIALAVVSSVLSTFMSNVATANIILPVATATGVVSAQSAAMSVAFGTALALSLPISTPPNAIAYATGAVTTRQMAWAGTIVSVVCLGITSVALAVIGG